MEHYAISARLFAGVAIITVWGLTVQPLSGVVLVLVLTALSSIRYRFAPYKWLIPAEFAVCVIFAFFWFPALFGLWFPAIGLFEGKWREWERELLLRKSKDRIELLRLERESENNALQAKNAAHLAEANERARIAQDIHDHAGHEITGALIALQTAANLYESGDKRTGELLNSTIKRLESATVTLRETVYNLKPSKTAAETLESLCDAFTFCEISFSSSSNLTSYKERSEIFAANLKEALTNISRHSSATLVSVKLDESADYIRMTVCDNGKPQCSPNFGMGLSGMKERVRAAGGTLTISVNAGFKIIQVLPKGENKT